MKLGGYKSLGIAILVLFFTRLVAWGGSNNMPIIPQLGTSPTFSASTVPSNGDLNPYGVAFIPKGFPHGSPLSPGDIIVSNFNNSGNLQGTGTTIVRVNDGSPPTVFFQAQPAMMGLSTALGVLKNGFILVGSVPSLDSSGVCNAISGPQQNVGQGALLLINKHGKLVQTLTDPTFLNGPWDLTIKDEGEHALVFVANALSGTITRLDLNIPGNGHNHSGAPISVRKSTQIASGYIHRCDPAAFLVAPTGVALDKKNDILYVSSPGDNGIFAISDASHRTSDAGMGQLIVSDSVHLHGPLGLVLSPNGDLISAQGDAVNGDPTQPSEEVEFNPSGGFIAEISVDPAFGGAFGLALRKHIHGGFVFAAVDDNAPVLDVWVVH